MVAEVFYEVDVVGHFHSRQRILQMKTRHLGRLRRVDGNSHAAEFKDAHTAKVAVK